MIKFSIGIPTLNRADLLLPTLSLYRRDFPGIDIHVLDNGNQRELNSDDFKFNGNFILNRMPHNIGVGASWNMLCESIFKKSDYALILNDDIYMGKTKEDINHILQMPSWSGRFLRSTPDWCAFLIPKSLWERIGSFDECFFPAYYEDKSYEYRMKLKGIYPVKTPLLNPVLYRSSQTLEKMPSLIDAAKRNKQLYIEMYGGEPGHETKSNK